MLAKHSLRVALLCIAVFGLQVAYVAPSQATATLRAAHCCATRCHHARSASAAARCCKVEQGVSDAAALSAPKDGQQSNNIPAPVFVIPAAFQLSSAGDFACSFSPHVTPRAAPIFLLTRTLRL